MYETDANPNPENLQRLPASLSESLDALNKDDFLKEFMSDKLLTSIKAIRKVYIWFNAFKFITPYNIKCVTLFLDTLNYIKDECILLFLRRVNLIRSHIPNIKLCSYVTIDFLYT